MGNVITGQKIKTKDLVETSLLIALVFLATKFINFKLPISVNGGLIHLGTAMLFIAAGVFGPRKGALSGAIGMALFDVMSGWALWAPFTFIIRGLMGYIVGKIAFMGNKDGSSVKLNILAMIAGTVWNLVGYYIAEVILYGNFITPFTSMPGDLIQGIVGMIIAIPIINAFRKIRRSY